MTAINANGHPILEGVISAPSSGAWWAEIQTLAPLVTGDAVTISDGITDLVGTVDRGGEAVTRNVARIVGGKGKLKNTSAANHWRSATVGKILGDIVSGLGESATFALDPSVSLHMLPFWSAPEETGGSSLRTLAQSGGWVWRTLIDGKVWMGNPESGTPEPDHDILEPHPEDDSYDVAPESLTLWPGKLQGGSVVKRVEYSLGTNLRCTYWL